MSKVLEKREELLEIARRRMLHYGIQKTSVHEIARDAGIAVGTLYLYFKNKEDIVLALADEFRSQQERIAEELLHSTLSPEEKISSYMLNRFRYVREFRESTPHAKEFVRTLLQIQPERVRDWRERIVTYLARCLEEGMSEGVFAVSDPEEEARLFFLATQGFFPLPYADLPQWPEEAELKEVMEWVFRHWKRKTSKPRN